MMFPVPTLDAVETINAPKDEIPFSFFGFSLITLIASGNRRTCTNFVAKVKIRPPTIRNTGKNHGRYKTSLI